MKVAHLIDSGGLYGAEHMLLSLCKEQQRQGLDVTVISIGTKSDGEKPLETALKKAGIEAVPWRMRPLPSLREARKIIQFCMGSGVDLIHSHGYKGNILLGLLPRFWRNIPVLTTMHGYTKSRSFGKLAIYQWLDRRCIQRLDAVVIVSPAMMQQVPAADLGSKLRVISNGVSTIVPPDRGAYKSLFRPGAFKIGAIGRLSHEKNFEFLIAAMPEILALVPHAQLIIYGEGPQRQHLQELIGKLGLENTVSLPGYTNSPDEFLRDVNVFVNCSLTEGMPISIIEAMRAPCHMLASDIPANRYLLEKINLLGQLFDLNQSAFCAALQRLYLAPDELKQQQKQLYRESFLQSYTLEKMAANYELLYRELIAK